MVKVKAVASAYYSVPPQDRHDVAIFRQCFRSCRSHRLDRPRYALPKAISGHQSYWLWGPRNYSGQAVIVVGDTLEGARATRSTCHRNGRVAQPLRSPVGESPGAVVPQPQTFWIHG